MNDRIVVLIALVIVAGLYYATRAEPVGLALTTLVGGLVGLSRQHVSPSVESEPPQGAKEQGA